MAAKIKSPKIWWNKTAAKGDSNLVLIGAVEREELWFPMYRHVAERPTKFYKPLYITAGYASRDACEIAIARYLAKNRPGFTLQPERRARETD